MLGMGSQVENNAEVSFSHILSQFPKDISLVDLRYILLHLIVFSLGKQMIEYFASKTLNHGNTGVLIAGVILDISRVL